MNRVAQSGVWLLCALLSMGCGNPAEKKKESVPEAGNNAAVQPATPSGQPDLQVKTFQNDDGSWGYDIFIEEKRYIHQPHPPAIDGNQGFSNQQQAQKVGELAAEKWRQGTFPPALLPTEVDSLLRLYAEN